MKLMATNKMILVLSKDIHIWPSYSQVMVIGHVCTNMENAVLLSTLPLYHPIVEDENHVLLTCPGYHNIRLELEDIIKNLIFTDMCQAFKCTTKIAKFVT